MEQQSQPYARCSVHTGDVAVACELIRRLTRGEVQAVLSGEVSADKLVAQQSETIAKSVVALGVLGCAHTEGALINQLTESATATS